MGSLGLDTTEWLHFHFLFSCTGEGNGNPLQCSCLENPRDGGAWWAAVSGVAQSQTWLTQLGSSSSSSSVQSLSCVQLFATPWTAACKASLSIINSCSPSQWCLLTISSSVVPFSSWLQSFLASDLFQWVSSSHQVAKVLELQLQHHEADEHWTPWTTYCQTPWTFRTDFL